MVTAGKDRGCWIQCQVCGHIYWTEEDVLIDKLYITSDCPGCGEYGIGLNCGDDQDDIYEYMNLNFDPRYYTY